MKWEELLEIVGDEPVFDSSVLMAGRSRPENVRQQLSRWVRNGRLVQLRRRIYALARPYRKVEPHPFYVANKLRQPSYVSLQSAMAFYGMIPEGVPVTSSVTTGRPESLSTGLGRYHFRHLKTDLFFGYVETRVSGGLPVFLSTREKALLDLLYLTPGSDQPSYLKELRLETGENFKWDTAEGYAERVKSRKLFRALERLENLQAQEIWATL